MKPIALTALLLLACSAEPTAQSYVALCDTAGTAGSAGESAGAGGAAGLAGSTAGSSGSAGPVTYSTTFDATENPLGESGAWHHVGTSWTKVRSSGGLAFGTQTGAADYDDSYAYLSGFPANQQAQAVIHKGMGLSAACAHEVELLLRWSDTASQAKGYEIDLSYDGDYLAIVRWNGPYGSFTTLKNVVVPGGVHDGDVLKATMIGTTIRVYMNAVQVTSVTSSTYATGQPGIGFYDGLCSPPLDRFSFTSFSATGL